MGDSRAGKDPFAFLEQQDVSDSVEATSVGRSLSDSKFGDIDLLEDDDMGIDMPFTSTDLGVGGKPNMREPLSATTHIAMQEEEKDSIVPTVSIDMEVEPVDIIGSGRSNDPSRAGRVEESPTVGMDTVQEEDYSAYPVYTIKRYRRYFNVATSDVLGRIVRSVLYFFKGDFLDHIGDNPDLYGPFWIASTLIFISAAAGNTASYIAHHNKDDQKGWYYDVDKVGGSMGLFYGYVGAVGLILFAVLKYFKSSASLPMIWCIYGYALVAYIPMAALCVIPVESARWALVSLATSISGVFLVRSLQPCVADSEVGVKSTLVLAVALGIHVLLGLALKLYFFNY